MSAAAGRRGGGRHRGGLVRRLRAEARPHRRALLTILAVDLLATPLLLLGPLPVKVAVDSVLGTEPLPRPVEWVLPEAMSATDGRLLWAVAVGQVLVVALAQLQQMTSYVLHVRAGELMTQSLRVRLFEHAQRLPLVRHDSRGSSESVYRIQYDAAELQKVVVDGLLTTVTSAVTLLTTAVVVAGLDWQLAVAGLLAGPLLVYLTRRYRLKVRPRYRTVKGAEATALQVVSEALAALRVVRVFGREDGERDRFRATSEGVVRERVRLAVAEGAFGLEVYVVTAAGTAAVLYLGVQHVQQGRLTLGELLMVIAYLSRLYDPLKTISKKAATLQSSLASAERVFEFLDEPQDVPSTPHPVPLVRARGDVEFRHVSLRYAAGPAVLDDVCLRVEPDTTVGLLGATGAGKTSLVALLARLYDPTSGAVLLDGRDLRDYAVADLRRQVAFVLQEPVLFSTSIAENIRYARPDAGLDEVVAAADQAEAHEFISRLPRGYETLVGERGMRLSGGERQRISLARAFLADGRVVVLDEPTSAVDVATEARILDAMDRLARGRTTFLVAHRASTLARCDRWVELRGGRIVQGDGGHVAPDDDALGRLR